MTKTALLKLSVAIVITFILTLPEYFKTPKGRILELSCLKVCLQPNPTYSLSSSNFSLVTFLQAVREAQIILGIFVNHSNFQNVTRICQDITSELKKCSSCLVCEPKGNVDFISQEQTSKDSIMTGSMERGENDFHSPCQHFNFTVAPLVTHLEENNTTCNLKMHTRKSTVTEEDRARENSINQTCRIMESLNNCTHISLYLEMDLKSSAPGIGKKESDDHKDSMEGEDTTCKQASTFHATGAEGESFAVPSDIPDLICSMKITWYALVLLVFVVLIILIIHKIREGHRVQKWQSLKYKPTSGLLRERDSEKLRALNVWVISESTQRLPLTQVKEELPPIPELQVTSAVNPGDLHWTW